MDEIIAVRYFIPLCCFCLFFCTLRIIYGTATGESSGVGAFFCVGSLGRHVCFTAQKGIVVFFFSSLHVLSSDSPVYTMMENERTSKI